MSQLSNNTTYENQSTSSTQLVEPMKRELLASNYSANNNVSNAISGTTEVEEVDLMNIREETFGVVTAPHLPEQVESLNNRDLSFPKIADISIEPIEYHYISEEEVNFKDEYGYQYRAHKDRSGVWYLNAIIDEKGNFIIINFDNRIKNVFSILQEQECQVSHIQFSEEKNEFIFYTNKGVFEFNYSLSDCQYIPNENEIVLAEDGIYSLLNALCGQYGECQKEFNIFADEYVADEKIKDIIHQYFPEIIISEEDLKVFFSKIRSSGCGYVVCANIILENYLSLPDEEWINHFGFPKKNFDTEKNNYQYLLLDLLLEYQTKINGLTSWTDIINLSTQLDNFSEEHPKVVGMDTDYLKEAMSLFSKKYDINIEVTSLDCSRKENYTKEIIEKLQNGESIAINITNINLYYPSNNHEIHSYINNPHGMIITEVLEDGSWVVSSWGERYIINPQEISGENQLEIFSFRCQ